MIHENVTHHLRRQREELGARSLPIHSRIRIGNLQVRLVDQCRRLQRVTRFLIPKERDRHRMQFVIQPRQYFLRWSSVCRGKLGQDARHGFMSHGYLRCGVPPSENRFATPTRTCPPYSDERNRRRARGNSEYTETLLLRALDSPIPAEHSTYHETVTTLPPTNPNAARDEATLYARASALFLEASELPDDEQAAFLRSHCDDDAIRRRVDAMLRAHAKQDGLLETLRFEAHGSSIAHAVDQAFNEEIPTPEAIGRYQIVRVIGHGGMGVVYEAEQDEPRRRVALKILPHGMITPSMVKRFRLEAEVLGHLQHPGIAQIYDAGTISTDDVERPFFAMEYIEGQTLLEYAENNSLTIDQRLELMARICDAVHHAHQKGIIHRDLKPGNILVVTEADGTPIPKVLDFGVARATDADIQSITLQTNPGQIIGTVPYMSPEQAAGDTGAIDIRSDVYALGVVAYELLTGRLPLSRGRQGHSRSDPCHPRESPVPDERNRSHASGRH